MAFFDGQELKKLSIEGGPAFTVCQVLGSGFRDRGSWSPDGKSIVFSMRPDNVPSGLYVVSAQGGTPSQLFESEHEQPIVGQPHFLPSDSGESKLLYTAWRSGPTGTRDAEIFLKDLNTGRTDRVVRGVGPVYSTGHIIFRSVEEPVGVWALPVSSETFSPAGEPYLIRDDAFDPSVSTNGILTYQVSDHSSEVRLVWRDRKGDVLGPISQPEAVMLYATLSPDGSRVAVRGDEGGGAWVHELERGVRTRISAAMSGAQWSPTGDELVFSARSEDGLGLDVYRQSADGAGEPELIYSAEGAQFVSDWSRDGRFILYDHQTAGEGAAGGQDVWYLRRRDGEAGFDAAPYLTSGASEKAATVSPDGSYAAYVSDESGEWAVYLQRFPAGGGKRRISTSGGTQPRWSQDGTELFYVNRDELNAVPIGLGDQLTIDPPEPLFQDPALGVTQHPHYDISADGRKFVVREFFTEDEEAPAVRAVVVLNWYEKFRDR